MVLLLNGKTLEATLPDMAMTAVVPMVVPDMTGHPPLRERAEGCLGGWLHDRMKMIGHQTQGENLGGMSGVCCVEQIEKGGMVGVLLKDGGSAVATVQQVKGVASAGSARNVRHEAFTMEGGEPERQEKSSPSFFVQFSDR
ncbi:MAG: hypothetical protein P0120_09065 [Nitrospira sp.]|nr:hypothetical protein [Nitrospira sp.]